MNFMTRLQKQQRSSSLDIDITFYFPIEHCRLDWRRRAMRREVLPMTFEFSSPAAGATTQSFLFGLAMVL